jgi:hypothetical protein
LFINADSNGETPSGLYILFNFLKTSALNLAISPRWSIGGFYRGVSTFDISIVVSTTEAIDYETPPTKPLLGVIPLGTIIIGEGGCSTTMGFIIRGV